MQSVDWYKGRMLISSLPEADKIIIRQDWEEITGRNFSGSFNPRCNNCYNDAIILILKQMTKADNGGYELLRGYSFRYKGKVYDCRNITKEAAEWWINQDLSNRDKFETLGKDYDSYANPTNANQTSMIAGGK